ncbi:tRNA-uridine aminocarboxypropyltransferase [Pseudoalteromonas sp. meg-B1]|uniref:tRNA-uridine aminocarboxypropyltransferase n=1 Tax=Pseudoalteromonas sp. meg-B1 TaxID=2203192 RepID=UPI000D6F080E|nr:tRNA-uridine aminocarboxypropyltransferase [Pseudoalteromonas sp. meg-B1]PWS56244.1 DTW domain-containing protein [Pseudoalteromonas sp. meg-B1]
MARALCEQCNFSLSTCICNAITCVDNQTQVVVLQHPSEAKISKNTAQLLALSLTRCKIIIGENNQDFVCLQKLPLSSTVLLYPNEDAIELDVANNSENVRPITHLIVLDGTWNKAFKILQLTPLLQKFKTVSFRQIPTNRYTIRKAPRADSLSTLEAVAHSLSLIEALNPAPLYDLLDELITKQTQHMPAHVKARYL